MDRLSISSGLMTASLSNHIAELRSRIGTASTEATTGRHEDLTLHLSGRIGKAMLEQKALTDIESDRQVLALRASRLALTQSSLSSIQQSASGVATSMLSAVEGAHESEMSIAARDAKAALGTVFASLNARYGERFLFSGDETATIPFSDPSDLIADIEQVAQTSTDEAEFAARIDDYFNTPTGGWTQDIFQGSVTSSDPEGVSADHAAIKSLVKNLAILSLATPDSALADLDGYASLVEKTALGLGTSETGIISLRADLGVLEERVAAEQARLDTEETILTASFNVMTARDQYEAATELQSLQTTLEASYLITARLSQLSLLNYLG